MLPLLLILGTIIDNGSIVTNSDINNKLFSSAIAIKQDNEQIVLASELIKEPLFVNASAISPIFETKLDKHFIESNKPTYKNNLSDIRVDPSIISANIKKHKLEEE